MTGAVGNAAAEQKVIYDPAVRPSEPPADESPQADARMSELDPGVSESVARYLTQSKSSVYFARGSAELNADAVATIALNAQRLKANPDAAISLIGFTEDLASRSYSLALAQQRTKVVGEALLNMGVPPRQIRAAAYGREEPGTAPCTTEICRISYRRVEFRYLKRSEASSDVAPIESSQRRAHRGQD